MSCSLNKYCSIHNLPCTLYQYLT